MADDFLTSPHASGHGLLAHPLLVTVVGVVLTALVSGFFFHRSRVEASHAKVVELDGLVSRMRTEMTLGEYDLFRKDALVFRNGFDGHVYQDALGLNHLANDDNLDLILDGANDAVTTYLASCGTETPPTPETSPDSCSGESRPYVEDALQELTYALVKRVR